MDKEKKRRVIILPILNKKEAEDMIKQPTTVYKPSSNDLKKAIAKRKNMSIKGSSKDYAKVLYSEFNNK